MNPEYIDELERGLRELGPIQHKRKGSKEEHKPKLVSSGNATYKNVRSLSLRDLTLRSIL